MFKNERSKLFITGQKVKYELFSILIHEGKANSGHYFCYIFDDKTQCWWKFNDRIVTKVEEH